jgi:hypothetical protein
VDAIHERVRDARMLWEADRREGAFLLALVSVAVRAKLEHGELAGDRAKFEEFLRSRIGPRITVEFRGEQVPLETVFYKWMRCELVHGGGLPVDVTFFEPDEPGALGVRAGGAPEYVLRVSTGWFEQLLDWAAT